MIEAMRAAALAALLGVACASAPGVERHTECPAPGPRNAEDRGFTGSGDPQRGARSFANACAGCHASSVAERAPDAPAHAPRLDCGGWLAETSDAALYDAINRGPGRYGHGPLPPLGEQLRPGEIADLVAYLRTMDTRSER